MRRRIGALFLPSNKRSSFLSYVLPAVVLCGCIVLTLITSQVVRSDNQHLIQVEFEALAAENLSALRTRMQSYLQSLDGGAGFLMASDRVTATEWKRYVDGLQIDANLPGINGIGWITPINADDRALFLEEALADGLTTLVIHPETDGDEKFIIRYIEPLAPNVEALGLDISFETGRRTAANSARETGTAKLTPRILLVQDETARPGFLLLRPLYWTESGLVDNTAEAVERFRGWVYAPFIGGRTLDRLTNTQGVQFDIAIFDGVTNNPNSLIYSNVEKFGAQDSKYTQTSVIDLYGRQWFVEWHSTETFENGTRSDSPFIIMMSGLGLTALLSILFYMLSRWEDAVTNRSKEIVAETEASFQSIVEATPDAIVVVDDDGVIVRHNSETERQFGYDSDKLIGQHVKQLIPLKTQEVYLHAHRSDGLKKNRIELPSNIDVSGTRNDGSKFPMDATLAPLVQDGAKMALWRIRDISEQKRFEREIIDVNEKLIDANRELSQFAYVASHDLQEPLRMVDSFLGLLKKRYSGKLDATADEYIEFAVDGARRMKSLINDLLDLSRISNKELDFVLVDTEGVLNNVKRILGNTIEQSAAVISQGTLPTVKADEDQLTRLFLNLIENSIKYSGEEIPKIHVSAARKGNIWKFSVSDTGIGIAPEFHGKIFEIFQRLHERGRYEGTGIGLASCKRIIERHDGEIWVTSRLGSGSTFHFSIPDKS